MRNITKVPNGPLIKKKGHFKGSTLKNGGSTTTKQTTLDPKSRELIVKQFKENQIKKDSTYEANTKSNLEKSIKDLALKAQQKQLEENRKAKLPRQKNGGPVKKAKAGAMIKRADGSYSRRGLWDNLRSKAAQNKKTGAKPKAPTKAMLTQEKRIKAKGK